MLGIRGAIKDIQNYREWISVIQKERANPQSGFNKFGFDHNFTYMIYLVMSLGKEDEFLPDNVKKYRVVEKLSPVNRYLDEQLNFAEYLVPEFNQILDAEGNPTLDYVIAYRFAFKTIGLSWLIKRSLLLGILTYICFKIPWTTIYDFTYTWFFSR